MERSENSAARGTGIAATARYIPAVAVGTFIVALVAYTITAVRDITWAAFSSDGGELMTAAATLGVPHPPGYPLYVLLGNLVYRLPWGIAALRFHLFSAVCMAGAAAAITWTTGARSETSRAPAGLATAAAAGLTFAFAPLVWSQAVVAEVYALNALMVSLAVWALLTHRPVAWRGVLLGLAVTTHLTSVLLIPWAFAATPRRSWPRLAGAAAVGLLPTTVLPVLALGNSPVVWGEPSTLSGWWWLISGALYRPNQFGFPPALWGTRAGEWLPILGAQFAWLGLPLLVWGAVSALHVARKEAIGLLVTAGAYLLTAFTYASDDAVVFTIPAILLLNLLLTFGLRRLRSATLLLPAILVALHFGGQYAGRVDSVRPAANELLRAAPVDALLLTPGDQTIFTLWYFQAVEGQRPDLLLVDENLFAFGWYRRRLQRLNPGLVDVVRDDLGGFSAANSRHRPVCRAALARAALLDCESAFFR